MTFLILFFEFFKIGLFAIGGGPATIPFLYDLADSGYGWFSKTQLADLIAISESTPGPVGINMATYAGYNAGYQVFGTAGGLLGGLIATLGIILPSIVIIIVIAKFLQNFSDNKYVRSCFYGIRPAVAALVAVAVFELFRISLVSGGTLNITLTVIAIVSFGLMFIKKLKKIHPVFWILAGAVLGIALKL